MAEMKSGSQKLVGGLALLSGYINKVRREEENVLYVISGDMLQGSLIDSEWKGCSTIEIMNYLAPDVVAIGNHEVDYGLPHLLFLEKMANFPLISANLYVVKNNRRLLQPYIIIKKAGFDILFTGIITEKIIDSIKQDKVIGTFVGVEEASQEAGKICNAYKNDDIDLTILLTHIGFESDIQLAKLLNPEWGVDMIIGGHSHTVLEKPEKVNNILIAQAGVGTNQIGRFDILVDDETNSIVDYKWKLIPIESGIAEPDKELEKYIQSLQGEVDKKYSAILTKFSQALAHPKREEETPLGNLIADALAEKANCDVMLVGSGAIRSKELGPIVTLRDFNACYPYDDILRKFTITGAQLWRMFEHFMRPENRNSEGECYQVNEKVKAIYSNKDRKLISLTIGGIPVERTRFYTICLPEYHFSNSADYLNITQEELMESGESRVVTTSSRQVLEEYFKNNQNLHRKVEDRLVYI